MVYLYFLPYKFIIIKSPFQEFVGTFSSNHQTTSQIQDKWHAQDFKKNNNNCLPYAIIPWKLVLFFVER